VAGDGRRGDFGPTHQRGKEPQNWLMNHRTYDGQRYSPLERINRGNVKKLKLAYAIALGGGSGNEFNQATPLAEDGFLYTVDSWAVVYKIDGTSGAGGRIVWRMDPKQEKQVANRGVALWGNLVISIANYPARIIATDKDNGKIVWETNAEFGEPEVSLREERRSPSTTRSCSARLAAHSASAIG
jgi:alcohol dehydrogenase (cytochrome c)